mgnify:CR=1 FL=1
MTRVLAVAPGDAVATGALPLAVAVAALAGLVSFASPCVLPLVPGFLGYVTGLTGQGSDAEAVKSGRGRAVPGRHPSRGPCRGRLRLCPVVALRVPTRRTTTPGGARHLPAPGRRRHRCFGGRRPDRRVRSRSRAQTVHRPRRTRRRVTRRGASPSTVEPTRFLVHRRRPPRRQLRDPRAAGVGQGHERRHAQSRHRREIPTILGVVSDPGRNQQSTRPTRNDDRPTHRREPLAQTGDHEDR